MQSATHIRGERENAAIPIPKCPTGIRGLDEITVGGLPRGRPTLVFGNAGSGKTLMGMQFLVQGALRFDEPGVCISFDETAEELAANVGSLGFDVKDLIANKKLVIDHVFLEPSQIEETGEFDLEALFVRLGHAVESVGAKRVLLDSIETLFAGLPNESILRAELRRLFRWLKQKQLTAIVTGERGRDSLTRHGIEEYISDCVILLDHRVAESVSTRRLRILKYRGSSHGTNEYPFLIDDDGISVLPVTSLELRHTVSREQISTGLPDLNAMLRGGGYFRGSSVLVSGTAGTGKTTLASHFVDAACRRGERCVYFSFEESGDQVVRNMESVGIQLQRWMDDGLLLFHASRPTTFGLEMHLVQMHKIVAQFAPSVVVIDPVTAMLQSGTRAETKTMLLRLIDFLKAQQITALMTTLTQPGESSETSGAEISSLVDTWLLVRDIESSGERNRGLYLLKARGVAHSNQVREFRMTDHGIELRDVYVGAAGGLLTGSARTVQESKDASEAVLARQRIERHQSSVDRKRALVDSQIAALRLQQETEEKKARELIQQEQLRLHNLQHDREQMAESRSIATSPPASGNSDDREGAPDERETGR